MQLTTNAISANIKKGAFKPHSYLSNVCLSHFQSATGFVSGKMFPTVPVPLSTSYFYEFNKDFNADSWTNVYQVLPLFSKTTLHHPKKLVLIYQKL